MRGTLKNGGAFGATLFPTLCKTKKNRTRDEYPNLKIGWVAFTVLLISVSAVASPLHDHDHRASNAAMLTAAASADFDRVWIDVLTNRELTRLRRDQAAQYVDRWRKLASKTAAGLQAAEQEKALGQFYLALADWMSSLTPAQRERASSLLAMMPADGIPPVDALVRTGLLAMVRYLDGGYYAPGPSGSHASAARAAARSVTRHNESWVAALNAVVPRAVPPIQLKLDTQVTYFDRSGTLQTVSGRQWVQNQVAELGYDNLTRWAAATGGDLGAKVLAMLNAYQGGIGLVAEGAPSAVETADGHAITLPQGGAGRLEFGSGSSSSLADGLSQAVPAHSAAWETLRFQPYSSLSHLAAAAIRVPSSGSRVRELASSSGAEQASPDRDPTRPLMPSGNLTERQLALNKPELQPILDKCVACHVMHPENPKAYDLKDIPSLKHAMRSGGGGTFQRKILRMMGPEADKVHIHFHPDEIYQMGLAYFNSPGDDETGPPPPSFGDRKGPSEMAFPEDTARARALQNPIVTMALMRCIVCHKDPESGGSAKRLTTLSDLRAEMRTMDPDRVSAMIERGYKHKRMIHIQDLKEGPALETTLLEIAKLPPDSRTKIGEGK